MESGWARVGCVPTAGALSIELDSFIQARIMSRSFPTPWALMVVCAAVLVLLGCGAVYPEVSAPVRPAPGQGELEPPAPEDIVYVDFVRAHIPRTTRDGRAWGQTEGSGPNAFAKLIVDGRDILVTPITSGTLEPTWPEQRRANYRIGRGADVRVELWDEKTMKNRPICLKRLGSLQDEVAPTPVEFVCEESGARIVMNILPGRPLLGLGLYYELQGAGGVRVTRVVEESPASRAGITPGTRVLVLQGRSVQEMDALDVKSAINANSRTGVSMELLTPEGRRLSVTLKEAAMYPLLHEDLPLER